MKGYLKLLLSVCILCNITTAWAVGANGTCGETIKCDEGLYCDLGTDRTNKCIKCPEAYPNSVAGTTNIGDCHVTCVTKNVTLGVKKTDPENKQIKQSTGKTCDNYYTLSCVLNAEPNADNTACQCKDHYEQSGNTCTGECYIITLDNNLINAPGTQYLSEKYGTGFYKNNTCSGTPLTDTDEWLIPTGIKWWQKFNGYSTEQTGVDYRFGPDGRPTNGTDNKTFEAATTLYGQWGKNNYTVEYYDGDRLLNTQICTVADYNASSPTVTPGGCPVYESSETNSRDETIGGWKLNKNGTTTDYEIGQGDIPPNPGSNKVKLYAVWVPCPPGYYCSGTKNPCPAGSTSPAGSTDIRHCYISAATKFIDDGFEFTLPLLNNSKINYAP